jgi:hypothetical protein
MLNLLNLKFLGILIGFQQMNVYLYKKYTIYKVLNTFFALDLVKKYIGQLQQPYQGLFFKWGVFFFAWMGCLLQLVTCQTKIIITKMMGCILVLFALPIRKQRYILVINGHRILSQN